MRSAFLFPGQGSQEVGMLSALAQRHPLVRETFEEASSVLGEDLWRLSQEGPKALLDQTTITQPAMLAADVALWRLWESLGGRRPDVMAGHSLGEYAALVAAGALDFGEALRLVRARARYMEEAAEGGMAAILGLSDEDVEALCREVEGVVEPANLNAPGQVVVAGERAAVEAAVELARQRGAKRCVPLAVSVPSHCSLMRPAAERLARELAAVPLRPPSIPVVQNASAQSHDDPDLIRQRLEEQLYLPVRWVESLRAMAPLEAVAEAGPGRVLGGLAKR
ncbi:MAG: [acyl-carrier-protein] S-malonyltransferase, partial [Gammaproteobacteria bacterium]